MILLTYPILIDFNWVRDSLIDKCDVYKYLHKNKFECKYPQSSIGFTYIDEIINILFDRCIQLNYFYNWTLINNALIIDAIQYTETNLKMILMSVIW